jgi:hypothetical protein
VKLIVVNSENVFKSTNYAMEKEIVMMQVMSMKKSATKFLRIKNVARHHSIDALMENVSRNLSFAITWMIAVIKAMNRLNVRASII